MKATLSSWDGWLIVFLWRTLEGWPDYAPTMLSWWMVSLPGITTSYLVCVGGRKDVCSFYVIGQSGAMTGMAHTWDVGLSS